MIALFSMMDITRSDAGNVLPVTVMRILILGTLKLAAACCHSVAIRRNLPHLSATSDTRFHGGTSTSATVNNPS